MFSQLLRKGQLTPARNFYNSILKNYKHIWNDFLDPWNTSETQWKQRRNSSVISSEEFLRRLEELNAKNKDSDEEMVMVATDVSSLFPSMNAVEAGRVCKEMIQDSDMEFELVEMLLYIIN